MIKYGQILSGQQRLVYGIFLIVSIASAWVKVPLRVVVP